MSDQELLYWQQRVIDLEDKVETLRLSRRVLMRLLEQTETDKMATVAALTRENRRLQKNNAAHAYELMEKNCQIRQLSERSGVYQE